MKSTIAIDISPTADGNAIRGVGYYTKNLTESIKELIKSNLEYQNFQIDLITQKQTTSKYNLIHYPYFDPFQLTLPTTPSNFIVTVHDLIPIVFPQHFPVGIKGYLKWLIQKKRLRQAKAIIVPSHHVKYQVSQVLNYPPENIYVTYEGADPSFKPTKNVSLLSKIKNKYSLPDKFVLFVGDINWNKNIPGLVNACLKLKIPLVIVGQAAVKSVPVHPWTKDIHWLQSISSPLIIKTGFVPDVDLPLIFNLATIYCQPSFAEGFGLPLLQAMQSGTPTCLSNQTSLPEISYHSGHQFDPNLKHDLEYKLKQLWQSSRLRNKYSKLGLARAKYFDWHKTAVQTLSLYRQLTFDEKK